MAWLDYFRRSRSRSATIAKERLSIIVAREGRDRAKPDYLPQLRQDILQVISKYERINLDDVTVNVESQGTYEVLELNIVLSGTGGPRRVAEEDRYAPFFPEAASPS